MVPFLLFGASGQSSCWLSGGHSYKRRRSFSFAAMLFWFGWRVVLFLGRILSESKRTESNQEGRQAADIKRYWLVSSCGWFSEASPVHSPDCACASLRGVARFETSADLGNDQKCQNCQKCDQERIVPVRSGTSCSRCCRDPYSTIAG